MKALNLLLVQLGQNFKLRAKVFIVSYHGKLVPENPHSQMSLWRPVDKSIVRNLVPDFLWLVPYF
jgi:hypothetical protein